MEANYLSALRLPALYSLAALAVANLSFGQTSTSALADKSVRLTVSSGLPPQFDELFAHHFANAGDVRLHYVIGGPADGPLVVLLHGWPQTWYTWRNVMPGLAAAGYRVVALDYRGAGESEKPQSGYDKTTMSADVRAVVQQLGATFGL